MIFTYFVVAAFSVFIGSFLISYLGHIIVLGSKDLVKCHRHRHLKSVFNIGINISMGVSIIFLVLSKHLYTDGILDVMNIPVLVTLLVLLAYALSKMKL